ncbi:PAS domain S-box-containing protein [Bacillus niacini]|uniref:PAS domain S-box-containing protein n=1 Tax=Neobacillus niacini TaxID=86668 RepID=A0A852TC18_9BACI|nr:sigma 54-interacting transcriptional regulator [Neobacillus niacini]NYE06350.1 PAS domain S-box-containing protein [Neobacillus niacini]
MNIQASLVVEEVKKVFEQVKNDNEIDSKLEIIGLDYSYICHYDPVLEEVVVDSGSAVNLPNKLPLIHKTICYDDRDIGVHRDGQLEYLYSSPIILGSELKYLLVCTSTAKQDSLMLLILELLASFISARLETHIKLQEIFLKNDHMKQITETVSAGSLSVDKFGTILLLNEVGAEMLGVTAEEVLGKPIFEVLDNQAFSLNVLNTRKPILDREIKIKINKGQYYFLLSSVPLYDNLNDPIGVLFHFKDIRKEVEMIVNTKSFFHFDDIIYQCEEMKDLIQLAKKAALQDSSILIEGESGTGKELIAQSIHNYSNRSNKPFIVIDCSAIPRNLVESELFGYEEGSFTGSHKGGRMGKFERANGGTVFLDEIGEMPLEIQSKLLRVIQSRSITRVGGHEPIPINIRIIAATNRNLAHEVAEGSFRHDLYYRLNVINLFVPALRDRKGDLPLLIHKLMEKTAKREKREVPHLSNRVMEVLENYEWPGNIRELENTMERAVILANGEIDYQQLPKRLLELENINVSSIPVQTEHVVNQTAQKPKTVMEQQLIISALKASNGNKSKAAKQLGIARSTLYEKMYQYKLL